MSYDEKQVIKTLIENLQNQLEMSWEFDSADIINGDLILKNNNGLKFKLSVEYIGYEK